MNSVPTISSTATVDGGGVRYTPVSERSFPVRFLFYFLALALYPLLVITVIFDAVVPLHSQLRPIDVFNFNLRNDRFCPFFDILRQPALKDSDSSIIRRRHAIVSLLLRLFCENPAADPHTAQLTAEVFDTNVQFVSPVISLHSLSALLDYAMATALCFRNGTAALSSAKVSDSSASSLSLSTTVRSPGYAAKTPPLSGLSVIHSESAIIVHFFAPQLQCTLFGRFPIFAPLSVLSHRTLVVQLADNSADALTHLALEKVVRIYDVWNGKLWMQLGGLIDLVLWLTGLLTRPALSFGAFLNTAVISRLCPLRVTVKKEC